MKKKKQLSAALKLSFSLKKKARFIFYFTLMPWYQVISGGGTEYKLIEQVKLIVLPTLKYTADSP